VLVAAFVNSCSSTNKKVFLVSQSLKFCQLEDELEVARSERALLEKRLDTYMQYSKKRKDESREALKFALAEAAEKHKTSCFEHELRVQEMNRSHAEQSEQLCREVIEANREVVRLQKKIAEMNTAAGLRGKMGVDRGIHTSSTRKASNLARKRYGIILLATLLGLSFVLGQLGYLPMSNKMYPPVKSEEKEGQAFTMLEPSVFVPFLQPKPVFEDDGSALIKEKSSMRVNVTSEPERTPARVKHDPTLRTRESFPSVMGPSKLGNEADHFLSPIHKWKSRMRRLLRFLKGVIRNYFARRQNDE
jgi:hypothetical protein